MSFAFCPTPPDAPIYLSGPAPMHHTAAWRAATQALQAQFPGVPIWSATDVFRSRAEWRHRLVTRLSDCGALVFLADGDGWIGKGVDTEIAAARGVGLAVGWLMPGGVLLAIHDVELGTPDETDWAHYRRVRPIGAAEVSP
ncbi:MAG: hypothetical protein SFV24_16855 [Gemmatimonadales bacterium]|nr:hypothetical protein [Gemmatimonadales bacterium]